MVASSSMASRARSPLPLAVVGTKASSTRASQAPRGVAPSSRSVLPAASASPRAYRIRTSSTYSDTASDSVPPAASKRLVASSYQAASPVMLASDRARRPVVAGGAPNIAAWLSAALRARGVARPDRPYVRGEEERCARGPRPSRGGRRRTRAGAANAEGSAPSASMSSCSARAGRHPGSNAIARDSASSARAVSPSAAACSATRMASAAPSPGSVSTARRWAAMRPARAVSPICSATRIRAHATAASASRPSSPPTAPATPAARSSVAAASASCPSNLRASAARIQRVDHARGVADPQRDAEGIAAGPVGDRFLHLRGEPLERDRVQLGPRRGPRWLSAIPGCSRTRVSRSTVAVHVACDSNERAS